MSGFLARRLFHSLIVMLIVSLLAFAMFNFVGDPVNQMVGIDTSPERRAELREELGLNAPVIVQFWHFITSAAQFDFGVSYQFKRPVSQLLAERMPATLELAFVSTLFALVIGIPVGVYTGLKRNSFAAKLLLCVSLVGVSLPTFLIGILLIFVFSVQLQVLPSSGRGQIVELGFWSTGFLTLSGLKALILPSITLGLFQVALIIRLVRSQMIDVMQTDYIRFAYARGLPDRVIYFGHALKNTLVPVITMIGLQVGFIIVFAIITESVFQWPGMGLLFLQAVQNADIPIMAAYLLFSALLFVIINLIVDMLYVWVDPRVRIIAPGREM